MEIVSKTSTRKDEHLSICLEMEVESSVSAGFERINLVHQALPESDYSQINTSTDFLGKQLSAPLLISSMTGGSVEGGRINAVLAEAAQQTRIALAVGSQRAAIENPDLAWSFQVRRYAPDVLVFANLGAVQLNYGYGVAEVKRAIEMIEADALFLHLNPLQEALQPEGNTDFSGLFFKIEKICKAIDIPIFVKEVGSGISANSAATLINLGVAGIDCAGTGGTSWALVEAERQEDPDMRMIASRFGDWGIPTVDCLLGYQVGGINENIIASGGIRSGLDVFKSLALGARLAGLALPFLKAAYAGSQALFDLIRNLTLEMKTAMFLTGSKNIHEIDFSKIMFIKD